MAAGQAIRDEPLLVSAATRVTCPKCEAEFSLEEGFAKNALEGLEHASQQSLAAIRESERQAVEKRAQEIAGEQQRTSSQELSSLRQLLKDQSASHARALAEVQELAAKSVAPQIEALKAQLTDSQAQLTAMDQREAALVARERGIETRIMTEAANRAAELVVGEKESYEKRLLEREQQLQVLRTEQVSLREERQRLKDEKAAMVLEVQRQVDARTAERETQVRAQEQERAGLEKAELQKTIDDMAGKLAEAQAKASQGSQQLQGEVFELAIEERLKTAFPLDTIEEVKKGERRAVDGLTECQAVGANALPRMVGPGRERRQEAEASGRGGDVIKRMLTRTGRVPCSRRGRNERRSVAVRRPSPDGIKHGRVWVGYV